MSAAVGNILEVRNLQTQFNTLDGVVRAVDSPAVRVLFDVFHVQARGGDVINALSAPA